MTLSNIQSLTTAVNVTSVAQIVVTSVVPDGNGGYVRAIRVYGEPDGTNAAPVFTLMLSTDVAANINLHTGDLVF